MRLKDIQAQAIIEKINEESLRLGVATTTEDIREVLNNLYVSRAKGFPIFIAPYANRKDLFEVERYNNAMASAEIDMDVLYNFMVQSSKVSVDTMSYVSNQRKRFRFLIKELRQRAESFDSINKSKTPVDILSLDFKTRTNVIPKQDLSDPVSECFIDSVGGAMTLPIVEHRSQTYSMNHLKDLNQALFVIDSMRDRVLKSTSVLPFGNIFKSNTNGWQQDVSLHLDDKELRAHVDIKISNDGTTRPINFSRIVPFVNNPMDIGLEYSINGTNFLPLHPYVSMQEDGYLFVFNEVDAAVLRVKIRKRAPDQITEDRNKFYLNIQRFETGLNVYENEGDVLLKGIHLDGRSIIGASLVDSSSNTMDANIRYFVSLDDSTNKNPNIEISPHPDPTKLDNTNMYRFSAYKNISREFVSMSRYYFKTQSFMNFQKLAPSSNSVPDLDYFIFVEPEESFPGMNSLAATSSLENMPMPIVAPPPQAVPISVEDQNSELSVGNYGYFVGERAKLRANMNQWHVEDLEDLQKFTLDPATASTDYRDYLELEISGDAVLITVPRTEDALLTSNLNQNAFRTSLQAIYGTITIEELTDSGFVDRTNDIDSVSGSFIQLSGSWDPDHLYKIKYHGQISEDISIDRSSINFLDDQGEPLGFPSDVDVNFDDWTVYSVDGSTRTVRMGFDYLLDVKTLREYTAWVLVEGNPPGEIVVDKLECSQDLGERIILVKDGVVQELTNSTKILLDSSGWYKMTVVSKPWAPGIGSAMLSVDDAMVAGTGNPDYAFRSGTGPFSVVSLRKEELEYVIPSKLYQSRYHDLSKFTVVQSGDEYFFVVKSPDSSQVFTSGGNPANEKFNFSIDYLERDVIETDRFKNLFMKIRIEKKPGAGQVPTYSPALRRILLRLEYA
jgi:hypothetical protein